MTSPSDPPTGTNRESNGGSDTSFYVSGVCLIFSIISVVVLAQGLFPRKEVREENTRVAVAGAKTVTRELPLDGSNAKLTADGKGVVFTEVIDEPEYVVTTVKKEIEVRLSPKERLWWWFMIGVGAFVGLLAAGVLIAWFACIYRNVAKGPPKYLNELLKYLMTASFSLFLGFMGGTTARPEEGSQVASIDDKTGQGRSGGKPSPDRSAPRPAPIPAEAPAPTPSPTPTPKKK